MLLGIAIGVGIMVLIIIAFAAGYGFADQKYNPPKTEDEEPV